MPHVALRPHQIEAVDSVLRVLSEPSGGRMPPEGLRAQVIAATGSGKTLIGVESANRLSARRVLVLVPTLDLLTQMADAWRRGGRRGAMVGVCSLRSEESQGVPCTTDPAELVAWTSGPEPVTVFATYASVGQGVLQRAHDAGLQIWDLMVVDEAHRVSGDAGRPWAAVHDQQRIPAVRRLYMTATARIWEAEGDTPRLVASMDEDSPVFGPVAYKLRLSEAVRLGLVAPYQVLCLDIRDPELYAALTSEDTGSPAVRGARLAAVQAGLMRAAVEERFRRVLAFHSRVGEAEAMAVGVPAVAARLAEDDPGTFPAAERVWAGWLYGEHAPLHRRQVLDEFASDFLGGSEFKGRDIPAALRVLSSVRVLGEGVDTAECDAVLFADARGSMIDIVQMVGRALRMQPGAGKLATLIVPVFLGPNEDPDEMLTSDAYRTLTKVLGALRAHDTETIEALADPRIRNSRPEAEREGMEGEFEGATGDAELDQEQDVARVSGAAAGVLRFSEERDPFALTQFVRLRIIDPEGAYWRRGIEAATRWLRETGKTELRVPYVFVAPDEWGAVGGYPLGRWIADLRRYYAAGTLEAGRVTELEALGMVWSAWETAWAEGLAVAQEWAAVHGHFLPPTTAVWDDGFPIGVWAKNQRAAARRTRENAERREYGETAVTGAGELPQSRLDALDAIDPAWCPAWGIDWQRAFHLTHAHVRAGGALPVRAGEVIVQGEDLGAWTNAQRAGWEALMPAQQWLLDSVLGLESVSEAEQTPARRTQADRWATHLAAARQFHAREGHLNAPRKHIEEMAGEGGEVTAVRLGGWLDNTRRRADRLPAARHVELNALGMRW
ncbi:DEAD/DEAH box helicase [Streptomyces mirabilis]|uniref:Helicase associated domain protein n=1 Tax=Streptomyces mirabilis TaxID=68239 RepID=A0ABU3V5Y9_9ACTN|nr:DEAD/DEAH box helicase [Streptomyces mirabilis]MCX5355923.1 Helicase associated domain protein [Streptomyces mirabilis]MDU9001565.1 Helicase associated domain protein [Streptomyces mirabilis]